MDPLQTQELAYFLTVADELHFGRAADRLGITQPPLSRAIKRLESRLGVRLFERTSRSVRLTPAGTVLREEGRKAMEALSSAVHRTRRAALEPAVLTLAMKPGGDGGLLPDVLAAYEARSDAVPVHIAVCAMHDRILMLRDGRADMALLHSPAIAPRGDLDGLDTEELLVERQVAVLPGNHRLAGRSTVRLQDVRGELHAVGRPGAVIDVGELTQLIALGRAVTLAPESVRGHVRSDLVCVPVIDAPLVTMLLAWPQWHRSPALAAFVRTATDTVDRRERGRQAAAGDRP